MGQRVNFRSSLVCVKEHAQEEVTIESYSQTGGLMGPLWHLTRQQGWLPHNRETDVAWAGWDGQPYFAGKLGGNWLLILIEIQMDREQGNYVSVLSCQCEP